MFNRPEHQKRIWQSRSKKERQEIGGRIRQTRRENGSYIPWNKGKKGLHHHSPATRKKISEGNKGKKRTEASRRRYSLAKRGDKNPSKRADVQAQISKTLRKRNEKGLSKKQLRALRRKRRLKWLRKHDPKTYKAIRHRQAVARAKKLWRDPRIKAKRRKGLKAAWARDHDARVKRVVTPEYRAKLSKANKGRPYYPAAHGPKMVWYYGPKGRIRMRHPSEVKYAHLMDAAGIDWQYEPVIFQVGKRQSWMPDFYLPAERKFVEVKGWLPPDIRIKIEKAIRHYASTRFEIKRCGDVRRLTL